MGLRGMRPLLGCVVASTVVEDGGAVSGLLDPLIRKSGLSGRIRGGACVSLTGGYGIAPPTAVALPIPRAESVTTATFPVRSVMPSFPSRPGTSLSLGWRRSGGNP
ncbi:hypothetical protein GCM10022420_096940 [Streptomyces iranensis]